MITRFVPFAERSLRSAVTLYQKTATQKFVIKANILHSFIKVLKIPLSLKYNCPSQSIWKLALNSFLTVLRIGLPIARQNSNVIFKVKYNYKSIFFKNIFRFKFRRFMG